MFQIYIYISVSIYTRWIFTYVYAKYIWQIYTLNIMYVTCKYIREIYIYVLNIGKYIC